MSKIYPKKIRRKHTAWYWMAFGFAACIGVLLGVNIALLIFASTSVVLLTLLEGMAGGQTMGYIISLIVAVLLGTAFLVGYIWTFAGASSTYEAAQAYAEENGCSVAWPQMLVVGLEVFFIGLDLISLWYRREFFAAKGAEQLFWFFVVLSLLSPIIGLLMHVLENKPISYRLTEAQRRASNQTGDDIYALVETMPLQKRTRLLSGDGSALADHFHEIERQRQVAHDLEQQRIAERKERKRHTARPLASDSLLNQADQGINEETE